MIRHALAGVPCGFLLLLLAAVAGGDPVITSVSVSKTPSNTGATILIVGTGFGNAGDKVTFPGGAVVTPVLWGFNNITVRVPATWSGSIRVQANGSGPQSNAWPLDVSFAWSGQHWPGISLPLNWYLNNSAAPGCTFNDTRDALVNGYNTWACASSFRR